MTIVEPRPSVHVEHPYTRRAWVALALAPVGFVVAIVIAFAASGMGPGVGGAFLGLLSLAAPTAAIILASYGVAAHQPSARRALAASVTAFLVIGVLLPAVMISGIATVVALGVSVAVLAVFSRPLRL